MTGSEHEEPDSKPLKYGASAARLFDARTYVQKHDAPDYCALAPYYAAQQTDSGCSAAAAAMVVNALRAERTLKADQELATPSGVLKQVERRRWRVKTDDDGDGVSLDELAALLPSACKGYGVAAEVELVRLDADAAKALVRLRELLRHNERSHRDIIVVNFLQGIATGDPEGAVGHFAPVAAFDEEADRVLLMDPDRRWYEPFWISTKTLLESMAAVDESTTRPRGLLRVTRKE